MSAIYDYGQRQKEEGMKIGIKEGREEALKKLATYMIKKGENNKEIQKETKLPLDKIQKIRDNI